MPREIINLYNVNISLSLTHDHYYRLQHLQENMKAGILPNICELTTTRIIAVAAFDYDARCAFYIAQYLRHLPKVTLLLVHRLRHWASIKPTLGKYRPIVNLMTGNASRRSKAGEGGRPRFFRQIILKSHLN